MSDAASFKESLLDLGPGATLVASLCESAQRSSDVAVLLFNAGVIPRMGPHRLWVKMARDLAGQGLTTLRFDLSGQGDSLTSRPALGETLDFESQAVADIRYLMDRLQEKLGIKRFVMVGICSGAAISYKASLQDVRIVGCAMLDVYMYPTWKTLWFRLGIQASKVGWPSVVQGLIRRRMFELGRAVGLHAGAAHEEVPSAIPGLLKPSKAEFAGGLQRLLNRGVPLLMIYTGSFMFHYNYLEQFRDGFRAYTFDGPFDIEFRPQIDHTLTALQAQSYFIKRISTWLKDRVQTGA